MKILELRKSHESTPELYIGNEFSPDPLEMLEKIRSIGGKCGVCERTMILDNESMDKYKKSQEDVKRLLTKNGYTLYNPCTVSISYKSE